MNDKKYNEMMKRILKIGSLVFLGSFYFLNTALVFAQATQSNTGPKFPNPFGGTQYTDSLYGFVYFVLTGIVFPIGSVVIVFFIIYAGYLFATARGSEDKLEKAKKTFLGVVIGTVILLGSWAIASAIKGTLCQIAGGNIPALCSPSQNLPQ